MKLNDLSGKKFGRLTVLSRAPNSGRRTMWYCLCDCGSRLSVRAENLVSGNTKSCGCIEKERPNATIHGMCRTRLAAIYNSMKQRCYNERSSEYYLYGGRGIYICDEWLNDRTSFFKWAAENGYEENAKQSECSIDRIDVNAGYSPDNCRWVNSLVQANNTRRNKYYELYGEKKTLAEWSRIYGIKYGTLYSKVNRSGLSLEEALNLELHHK